LAKTAAYVMYTQQKIGRRQEYEEWNRIYGIGGCFPLATRKEVFRWACANEKAEVLAVPATSVAEGVYQIIRLWPEMRQPFTEINGSNNWLRGKDGVREKGTSKMVETICNWMTTLTVEKIQGIVNANPGLSLQDRETLLRGGNLSARLSNGRSNLSLEGLFCLIREMAKEMFLLGGGIDQLDTIEAQWHHRVHEPTSPFSHPRNGAQADVSEIVVRNNGNWKSIIPWQMFVLWGDSLGTTKKQTEKTAELMTQLYPEAQIFILVNPKGEPYAPESVEAWERIGAVSTYLSYALVCKKRN